MVSQWRFSDSKSPQVLWTLLTIRANLNNSVFWMITTRPLFSNSSSPSTNLLVTVPRGTVTIVIIVTFIFHTFFKSKARFSYLSTFPLYFNITLWSAGSAKYIILQVFSFFLRIITRSGRLAEIKWSVHISEEFVCLILQDRFWDVNIPFVRVVKLHFLGQFPMDLLTHLVASSLIFFLS